MAVTAGEVIDIIKCIPVEVKLTHVDRCYNELPVRRKDTIMSMTPRTHILKSKGTEVSYNPVVPSYYLVGDVWYTFLPKPHSGNAPNIIKTISQPT